MTYSTRLTRSLLTCGAVAGLLFILVVLIQDYTRPGFDPRRHPLSLHALGEWGWIQSANFVVTGALNIAYALGLRRALHPGPGSTWGPLLVGVYGAALVVVGLYRADPAFGYPRDVIPPQSPTAEDLLHGLAAIVAYLSLAAACAVFAHRFGARRGWGLYSAVTGVVVLVAIGVAMSDEHLLSQSMRAGVLAGWGWSALVALHLRAELTPIGRTSIPQPVL